MLTAQDVANFFIDLAQAEDNMCLTNEKVNKLVYLAQGWSIVRLNRKLFDEIIQAHECGPVVPSIYLALQSYNENHVV